MLIAALAAVHSPRHAEAAPGESAAQGRRALAAGKVRQALGLFTRAAREEPRRGELLCEVGRVHQRLGQLTQAQVFLARCVAAVARLPEGAEAALRRVTAAVRDGRYAPVAIDVRPAGAALRISPFAADEVLSAPIDLWLPFGTHSFTLTLPGHEEHRGKVIVDSNARQMIAVVMERSGTSRRVRRPATVDFEAGPDAPAIDAPITAPDQRPLKHDTLMPERFRGPSRRPVDQDRARPLPLPTPATRVLSWNLKRLGHGKKRMDLVARMLAREDVAVLQEVMTPAGVHRLLAHLPGWSAVISPRAVGRGGYAEHYAVLYRRARVRLLRSFTVDDPSDQFVREPFVVCLKVRAFDFCVVTVHVVFGRTVGPRNAEIEALGPLLDRLMRRSRERDWLVVGDFNRPARAGCWGPLAERGWTMARLPVPTSISARGYRNDYDHLLLNPRHTREWTREAERLDFVTSLCRGNFAWCLAQVSDHAPIYAAFSTAGPDDD